MMINPMIFIQSLNISTKYMVLKKCPIIEIEKTYYYQGYHVYSSYYMNYNSASLLYFKFNFLLIRIVI